MQQRTGGRLPHLRVPTTLANLVASQPVGAGVLIDSPCSASRLAIDVARGGSRIAMEWPVLSVQWVTGPSCRAEWRPGVTVRRPRRPSGPIHLRAQRDNDGIDRFGFGSAWLAFSISTLED